MNQSDYTDKVLENIAQEIGGYFVGTKIVKIIKEITSLTDKDINYPATKWVTVKDTFLYLQNSREYPANDILISKLISGFIHPLNHNLDTDNQTKLRKKIESILKYNNFYVIDNEYHSGPEVCHHENISDTLSIPTEAMIGLSDDEDMLKKNKDKIREIIDYHQQYVNTIELFYSDLKNENIKSLNDAYVFLSKRIVSLLGDLNLSQRNVVLYRPFKGNLYSVEAEEFTWDKVKPHLYEVHGLLEELYTLAEDKKIDDDIKFDEIKKMINEIRSPVVTKSVLDYTKEIINEFRDQYEDYNRVKGLKYNYCKGVHLGHHEDVDEVDTYSKVKYALNNLRDAGVIRSYTEEYDSNGDSWYLNAECLLDENKLMGYDEKLGESKVQHEYTLLFKNSIQEKDIVLNHKFEDGKPSTNYITKNGDDFYYKGLHILATKKNNNYYKVFSALYAKLPDGGEISYKDLITEIKSRMPEQKNKADDEMQKFIQRNLTDRSNGFMRYAKIPKTEDNGKPLISVTRGSALVFNNKTG